MKNEKQLNDLAIVVHTSAIILNALIAIYNGQRGNKKRAVFHTGLMIYEIHAVHQHLKGDSP